MFLRRTSAIVLTALVLCASLWGLPSPFSPTRIYTAVNIEHSPDSVFDFVTTARNWPRWHPSSLAVAGAVDHSATVGEYIIEDVIVAGHRGRARWTVTARESPRRWVIEGEVEGGGAGRLSYDVVPRGSGTRFEREFVYAAPNLLFAILDRIYIRKRIAAESALALQRLRSLMEVPGGLR